MRRLALTAVAVACVVSAWCPGAVALDTPAGAVTLAGEVDFVSRYIWRGFDLIADNNPALQPSFTVGWAPTDTLSLSYNVWADYRITDTSDKPERVKNEWDEIDHTVNADYAVNDAVTVSLGYIFYHLPVVPDSELNDTQEVYAGVSVALPYNLSTNLTLYYDLDGGKGIYAKWSNEYSRTLVENVSVFTGFAVGYMNYTEDDPDEAAYLDDGGDPIKGFSDLPLWLGFAADAGYGFSLTTSLNYSISLNDDVNDNNETWVFVGLGYEL